VADRTDLDKLRDHARHSVAHKEADEGVVGVPFRAGDQGGYGQ
jgi:hypothetical protein